MSEAKSEPKKHIDFDPILPEAGVLFYEECPTEQEIQRPILLPLKSYTQTRFENLQHEAANVWRETRNKTSGNSSNKN